MTDENKRGAEDSGDGAESDASDGLDAWMAANFPPREPEPQRPKPAEPEPPELVNPEPPAPAVWPPLPAQTIDAPLEQPPAPTPPSPPSQPDPAPVWPTVAVPEQQIPPAPPPPEPAPLPGAHGDTPQGAPEIPPMAEELTGIPEPAEFPPPPTEVFAETAGPSGLDSLFGESAFLEYGEGPAASENPFVRTPAETAVIAEGTSGPRKRSGPPQAVLLWIAGSLVAVLALVALFIVGTKLPLILGPAPGALVAPTTTPSPTPTTAPLGPVKPGEYLWNELLGGECLDPYTGPWEVKYTVVDCAEPHPAQLVTRGTFPTTEGSFAYPGIEALQSQVNLLCTAPTVVDYSKANAYTDIQFEASYAISEDDWFNGNHSYYCFLTRGSGEDITGSIAMPQVAPTPGPSEPPAP